MAARGVWLAVLILTLATSSGCLASGGAEQDLFEQATARAKAWHPDATLFTVDLYEWRVLPGSTTDGSEDGAGVGPNGDAATPPPGLRGAIDPAWVPSDDVVGDGRAPRWFLGYGVLGPRAEQSPSLVVVVDGDGAVMAAHERSFDSPDLPFRAGYLAPTPLADEVPVKAAEALDRLRGDPSFARQMQMALTHVSLRLDQPWYADGPTWKVFVSGSDADGDEIWTTAAVDARDGTVSALADHLPPDELSRQELGRGGHVGRSESVREIVLTKGHPDLFFAANLTKGEVALPARLELRDPDDAVVLVVVNDGLPGEAESGSVRVERPVAGTWSVVVSWAAYHRFDYDACATGLLVAPQPITASDDLPLMSRPAHGDACDTLLETG